MRQAIVLLACVAAVLFAGDPWKTKKPTEWSEKDSAKILLDSPWAKLAMVEMHDPAPPPGAGTGGIRGTGATVGTAAGGGGGRAASATGRGMTEDPSATKIPTVTVRWESAEPALEAFARVEYTFLPKLRELAQTYYIVTATGLPFDPGQAPDRLLKATCLKRSGKEPIPAARVETIRISNRPVPIFLFPRTDAIAADDKDVLFESTSGRVSVKAKFHPKEMQYDGKLAL